MPPCMAPVAPLFHPLPSYADAAGSSLHQRRGTPHPMAGVISVPVTPVVGGLSRSVAETFQRRSRQYERRIVEIPKLTLQVRFSVARYGHGGLFGRVRGCCWVFGQSA